MPLVIDMSSDIDELIKEFKGLQREVFPKALAQTLNRLTATARSRIIKHISADTGIKQKDIREGGITFEGRDRANFKKLYTTIHARRKGFNLVYFAGAKQTPQGVKVKAWKRLQMYEGAFIAPLKFPGAGGATQSRRQVMMRKRNASGGRVQRLPIKKLWGPSMLNEFTKPATKRIINQVIAENFGKELGKNLAFYAAAAKRKRQR